MNDEHIMGVVEVAIDDGLRLSTGDNPLATRTIYVTTEHMGVKKTIEINLYGKRMQDLDLYAR